MQGRGGEDDFDGTVIRETFYRVASIRKFDKNCFRHLQRLCLDFMENGKNYVEKFEALQECFQEQSTDILKLEQKIKDLQNDWKVLAHDAKLGQIMQ